MVAALSGLDSLLVPLVLIGWLIAGAVVIRLPYGSRPGRAVAALVLVGLVTAARVAVVVALAGYGWWFVPEKVLSLGLVAVPAVAVLALSVPRIARLSRRETLVRWQAAHPAIGVPVRAATFGALAGWVIWLFVGYGLTPVDAAVATLAVAALTGLSWWLQAMRYRRLSGPGTARPGFGVRVLRTGGITLAVLGLLIAGAVAAAGTTRLPDRMAMDHHEMDYGGGEPFTVGMGHGGGHMAHSGGVSVTKLRGTDARGPVKRFTLTAQEKRLSNGFTAWTYNGQVPGPEIRVRQGDVVEVTLLNHLPQAGVTIHWHGYDVPNGEDGVAGVTQDAVRPGGKFVYRFKADQVGTYWYHSHELSSEAVQRGLYGVLVVEPREDSGKGLDLALPYHELGEGGVRLFGDSSQRQTRTVAPGTPVRLRLVNTSNSTGRFAVYGTPYRLVAIDGTDVDRPGTVRGQHLALAGGGRYDVAFTMPDGPVLVGPLGDGNRRPDLLLSPDGSTTPPGDLTTGPELDITSYGEPAKTPFDADSHFDRQFTQVLDTRLGFYDGGLDYLYTVNGKAYPDIPTLGVRYGDLVKVTVVNRGLEPHPMHPHGHHVLVLSRNGKPVSGSPLWMDTFEVNAGEVWEVAFRADNPGIWMDHCHNLWHAANGMMFHLAYEGVSSPYQVGRGTLNHPE
jgi:FtsP/CotA-like multicopper oxidase with cupredoxin domain